MVAAYRVGAVEAWIMRRLIAVKSVILANLVIGENVVPEYLQQDCTPEKLLRRCVRRSTIRRCAGVRSRRLPGSTASCRPATSRRACAPPTSCWRRCAGRGGRVRTPGWAKRSVPTSPDDGLARWWARRKTRLCPPNGQKNCGRRREHPAANGSELFARLTCAWRSRRSRGGSRRYRAGADGRSSAAGPRSSRSTG